MAYRSTEKTRAKQQAQHKLLLDSSMDIVASEGFKGLTMVAVAKRANLATGTVYKYFENKADLCAAVFKAGSGREVESVRRRALDNTSESCQFRLVDAATVFAERAIAGKRLAYALIAEPGGPLVEAERLKYRHAYAEVFATLFREGVEKGEFYPQNEDLAAAAIVGMLAEILLGPLSTEYDVKDPELIVGQIRDFCIRAFVKPPV